MAVTVPHPGNAASSTFMPQFGAASVTMPTAGHGILRAHDEPTYAAEAGRAPAAQALASKAQTELRAQGPQGMSGFGYVATTWRPDSTRSLFHVEHASLARHGASTGTGGGTTKGRALRAHPFDSPR